MRNYIIFDLEATCDTKEMKHEIIEIGAVKVNEKGEIVDTFNRFVKPIINPVLTDFCKVLTKIPQEKIDQAEGFKTVIEDFKNWIGDNYVLCSWGFYDRRQLQEDCKLHGLKDSWVNHHISLKHQHQKIKGLQRAVGLGKALNMENMRFEGTPHRGIDDAKNINKIFLKYRDKWSFGN